jgi:hypothetical protein
MEIKNMIIQIKKGLAILFSVLFVVSLTTVAADAHGGGWGGYPYWWPYMGYGYGYPYYGYPYGAYVGVPYTTGQYSAPVTSAQGQYSNQAPTQSPASAAAVGVRPSLVKEKKTTTTAKVCARHSVVKKKKTTTIASLGAGPIVVKEKKTAIIFLRSMKTKIYKWPHHHHHHHKLMKAVKEFPNS